MLTFKIGIWTEIKNKVFFLPVERNLCFFMCVSSNIYWRGKDKFAIFLPVCNIKRIKK